MSKSSEQLLSKITKRYKDTRVKQSGPCSLRLFVYHYQQEHGIEKEINGMKDFEITRKSVYPTTESTPYLCVFELRRLRFRRKTKKA